MAIGAGFCLALLADMRVGAEKTKVGLNFARIGMHSGMAGSVGIADDEWAGACEANEEEAGWVWKTLHWLVLKTLRWLV
jgi:hypothetical protein